MTSPKHLVVRFFGGLPAAGWLVRGRAGCSVQLSGGDYMSSDLGFVEFVVEQIENAGEIRYKKMFGEFALYSDGIIFALICDDQLFMKPTEAGRSFIDPVVEAPPYPKAKPYFLIEDQLENKEWLSTLVRLSVKELPTPKKRK